MECPKCEKKFNEAGNIRNYKIVCPNCIKRNKKERDQLGRKIEKTLDNMQLIIDRMRRLL